MTKKLFGNKILYMPDEYSALENADCLVIITEWNQFRKLDLEKVGSLMRQKKSCRFKKTFMNQVK